MRWVVRIGLGLLVIAILAAGYGYQRYARQGIAVEDLAYPGTKILVDAHGVPTIEAERWLTVVEAQGYVEASQRLFQMDLLRRAAGGRLAEIFGARLVPWDRRHREEDWLGAADAALDHLDDHQKAQLEAYTVGVNRFISENDGAWGLEYTLLRLDPEPWKVRDSILILMQMCDQLSVAAASEASREAWREKLPPEWFRFLHPLNHPWNRPLFGTAPAAGPEIPQTSLPKKPVSEAELAATLVPSVALGSNSWGWCGKTGCYLANDPHLGANVPHLWYLIRLRRSAEAWVVGVSIPGLPGVVLGMNQHLAWAFTNVGEDVDDYLLEKVDGERYLESVEAGREIWKPIERRPYEIKVKDGAPVRGVARFTHRGPLAERKGLTGLYSRQWLPLKKGMLSYASRMNEASSWEEMNAALDRMAVPAQNVLIMDRKGNLGYRATGTGVVRRVTGRKPQPAVAGEWVGFQDRQARPRLLYYAKTATLSPTRSRFIATANQRIWVDAFGHRWAEDLRFHRIQEVLASRDDFHREDMNALQLDTKSEYHRRLIAWVADKAKAAPDDWASWDGVAQTSPEIFTVALEVERMLTSLCVSRIRDHFGVSSGADYRARLDSAWVLTMLEHPEVFSRLGLDETETAEAILAAVKKKRLRPYAERNRWAAQHPFVGRVPLIGDWFAVRRHLQHGWPGIVRVEAPKYGASTRLVWNLTDPADSTWATPVGQSGHVRSPHFSDLQEGWFADRPMKVFDERFDWGF